MARLNPWDLPVEAPRRLKRTLHDRRRKLDVPFAVRELDGMEILEAQAAAREAIVQFVLGMPGKEPQPLVCGDGSVLDMTAGAAGAEIIENAFVIAAHQEGPEEQRFSWVEIIGWLVRGRSVYNQMQAAVLEVDGEAELKNSSGAATNGSAPPATSTEAGILTPTST